MSERPDLRAQAIEAGRREGERRGPVTDPAVLARLGALLRGAPPPTRRRK
jgi:hypothetical protein